MISHKHKCIFIHIPKCAGTSIEAALGHFEGEEKRWYQDHRSIRMYQSLANINIFKSRSNLFEALKKIKFLKFTKQTNINNLIEVNDKQYNEYYKFTVVRNPYRRVISWYENVMRDEKTRTYYNVNKGISFHEFVNKFLGTRQLESQLSWLVDYNGEISVDKVIKFENLAIEFEEAKAMLKDAQGVTLPHKLKGKDIDLNNYYDDETQALVYEFYKREFEIFEYDYS
ncbi:sulfotransferase family 2 domain-containing protein [Vibrio splendidus]|uniref:sulfotransferase family 2 domain-containing protein n=1 Tax=Vibrio splendidus TaxID=29497 RepID=UPI000313E418|nr:sulfotransferase family 2 domain-containing protein [Vibrio splendidus]